MVKYIFFLLFYLFLVVDVNAKVSDFEERFKVDMDMELPDFKEYLKKMQSMQPVYDRGYKYRKKIGNTFKKEFGKAIKMYGMSEGRIKHQYEDDLMEMIMMLPKDMYQYIGPYLHQVPGIPEKILNIPGIKETKNQFPQKVAEKMLKIENIELISPALYFVLMPEVWEVKEPEAEDAPQEVPIKKPDAKIELPDFLKERIGVKEPEAPKTKASAQRRAQFVPNIRTLNPSKVTPLTTKDAEAFLSTIDDIVNWGMEDNMRVFSRLTTSEVVLDMWEEENGLALTQNTLKDAVNPCQRLILKIKLANLYAEFKLLLSKYGFTPEGWAYVGDKTIKAFRVANSNPRMAEVISIHRKGGYDEYLNQLPEKWRDEMFATEAALVKMYSVFKEDVDAVRPLADKLDEKFLKINGAILTAPVIY